MHFTHLLYGTDWHKVFVPDKSLLEIFVRGSIVYLAIFLLFRLVVKREVGSIGVTDVLVIVLVADAAQNAMADDYQSVSDGLLLICVLVFWSVLIEWLGYFFPAFNRFFHPPPLPLIRDGRLIRGNMRRELITPDELMSLLREQGIRELGEVEEAFMEGDGRLSVVKKRGRG